MSAAEETTRESFVAPPTQVPAMPRVVMRFLEVLSSVRFGIVLLISLVALSMVGMLIMQQEVDGFDHYFEELTPSQRLLYSSLGLFDIYHAWYFNLLLLVLSLNIVLASIDRFPKAWTFISRPKLDASPHWLRGQKPTATLTSHVADAGEVAQRIAAAAKARGFRTRITQRGGRTFVFAESGAWNRLGAYAVHVALLLLFLGSFISNYFERTGTIRLAPGTIASQMTQTLYDQDKSRQVGIRLPFAVECTDIEQKLRERDGDILAGNTLDWITRIRVQDAGTTREATISLNKPFDYRGYRFFQASFIPQGSARTVNLRLTPEGGGTPQDVSINRYGESALADGTRIKYVEFFPDFTLQGSRPTTRSNDYNNPAVQLEITAPNAAPQNAYAFARPMPAGIPVSAPVAGYTRQLVSFEKSPLAHVLSVKHDPFYGSTIAWYLGGPLLILTLCGVFFFSHKRIWAAIEGDANEAGAREIVIGGNTNRNQIGFEDTFKKLVASLEGDFKSRPSST